jgi:release factor glutamine methyltransferase
MNIDKETRWLLKDKYNGKATNKFYKDVERLREGEPLDYVIGFTEFGVPSGSCKIDLSKKPLIPRPETEFWVSEELKNIKTGKVLDIFSGSGCIGIAILMHIKSAKVVFVDNDKNCIKQIKINLKLNNVDKKRYRVIKSNIFDNIKNKYDFIFANPPYIPTKNEIKVQKSVLKYEPKKALFAGKDGLTYIKKFLKQAKNHLNLDGKIFMEFDSPQKNEIEKLLRTLRRGSGRFCGTEYSNFEFKKDQYGKYRWVVVC